MKRPRRIAVLASGGQDSAALLGWALHNGFRVTPIYVRQGLRWEQAELHALRRFLRSARRGRSRALEPLRVVSFPMADLYRGHWSLAGPVPAAGSRDAAVYLPGRNLALLAKAAILCAMEGIPAIALGVLRGNPFPDARPGFFAALARAARIATARPVRILAPFARLSKRAAAAFARFLPAGPVFSCLAPRGLRPCGRCNKCAEAASLELEAGSVPPVR